MKKRSSFKKKIHDTIFLILIEGILFSYIKYVLFRIENDEKIEKLRNKIFNFYFLIQ